MIDDISQNDAETLSQSKTLAATRNTKKYKEKYVHKNNKSGIILAMQIF